MASAAEDTVLPWEVTNDITLPAVNGVGSSVSGRAGGGAREKHYRQIHAAPSPMTSARVARVENRGSRWYIVMPTAYNTQQQTQMCT
jgi:hypothetical protein